MTNEAIAAVFDEIADILELQNGNPFKVRAYRGAARQIRGISEPLSELAQREKGLEGIPGIGDSLREKILELTRTGKLAYYEKARKGVPDGVLAMLRVPDAGPKKVYALWKELGVTGLAGLEKACRAGEVAKLRGFGEKSQQKILHGIQAMAGRAGRYRLGAALPRARALLAALEGSGLVGRAAFAGSVRRGKPLVKDVDLLVTAKKPEAVMELFRKAPGVVETIVSGRTKTSVRLDTGMQADLRVVAEDEFPWALLYFTGSKEHNILLRKRAQARGLKLSEYGLFKGSRGLKAKTEEDCYRQLGLQYVPPELREASGEIEPAEKGEIPRLVELGDLQGVFHNHSTWSDGVASIETMAKTARDLGLKYLGLSDHSKAAYYANGMDEKRLRAQAKEIAAVNRKLKGITVLQGIETDILPDGTLDMDPEALAGLDFVIGSVHSSFKQGEKKMTERVNRALADENLDILGHPTGRLLLERDEFEIDLGAVIETAAEHGKCIEINASPYRLDLEASQARRAAAKGVPIAINPDAHRPEGLSDIEFGVLTARRAGLTKEQVLNTRPWAQVRKSFDR